MIVDLHDKPGAMGEIARDLAEAGVNIDVAYTIFSGVRLVIVTEDVEKAARQRSTERRLGLTEPLRSEANASKAAT